MNKKLKKLVSGTSVTLCALIAFSLPTQVFAQKLPITVSPHRHPKKSFVTDGL